MSPRARLLLAGLLVLLVAGAVAIALSGRRLRGMEVARQIRPGEEVLRLDGARPVRLDLAFRGERALLEAEASGWTVRSAPGAAQPALAEQVLARLGALRRRGTLAGGGSAEVLRPYGLDAPRAVAEVGLDDGRALRVAVGRGTGEDGATFVQAPDGSVAIVRAEDAAALLAEIARLFGGDPPPGLPGASGG